MSPASPCRLHKSAKQFGLEKVTCFGVRCTAPTHKHTETGLCGNTPRGGSQIRANRRSLTTSRSGDLASSLYDACNYIPVGWLSNRLGCPLAEEDRAGCNSSLESRAPPDGGNRGENSIDTNVSWENDQKPGAPHACPQRSYFYVSQTSSSKTHVRWK
jgi:hypothetical protein